LRLGMAGAYSSNGVNQSGNVIEPYHSRRGISSIF
jgi:hypothetical protein